MGSGKVGWRQMRLFEDTSVTLFEDTPVTLFEDTSVTLMWNLNVDILYLNIHFHHIVEFIGIYIHVLLAKYFKNTFESLMWNLNIYIFITYGI